MQASKLAIVALVAAGATLAGCGGGGKHYASYVEKRFTPCLNSQGMSADTWSFTDQGKVTDTDGKKVYGVTVEKRDGTQGPFTVYVDPSQPTAVYFGTFQGGGWDEFADCSGTPTG